MNVSIHAINKADFFKLQDFSDDEINYFLSKQQENFAFLKEKQHNFKINSVILDLEQMINMYDFVKSNEYNFRFLTNLGTYDNDLIIESFLHKVWAILNYRKETKWSSNVVDFYRTIDNFSFGIKKIIDYKNSIVCKWCKEECFERFYWVRLEKYWSEYYFRLCLHKTDRNTFMNYEDFIKSDFYKSLF